MDPEELDLLVAGASTHCWVGQAGNSDCCIGGGIVNKMIETGKLTKKEGQFIIEELQRPSTKERFKKSPAVLESLSPEKPKERPELVPHCSAYYYEYMWMPKNAERRKLLKKLLKGWIFWAP